jgi:hypothetical protein
MTVAGMEIYFRPHTCLNPDSRGLHVREETRIVLLNAAGLASLVGFTGLVYLRTQQPIILLVGGLISVVSVIFSTMRKA